MLVGARAVPTSSSIQRARYYTRTNRPILAACLHSESPVNWADSTIRDLPFTLLLLLWLLPVVLQVSRDFILRVRQVLSVFRPLVVFVYAASTRTVPVLCEYSHSTEILAICPVILKYGVYFDRLRTVSTIFRPIVRHGTITDGPTRWSWDKLLSLGTARVLGAH